MKNAIMFKGILLAFLLLNISQAYADKFLTGRTILAELEPQERYLMITGIVQGLGYARFLRDKPDETGLICISSWFFDGDDRTGEIERLFSKFPDYPPSVVVWTLVKKECGE